MKKLISFAFAIMLILSSCKKKPDENALSMAIHTDSLMVDSLVKVVDYYSLEIKKIIEVKNKQLEEWYKAGLVDSIVTLFTDTTLQMPPNQAPIRGKETLRSSWSQLTDLGEWVFSITTEEVKSVEHLAMERGRYSINFYPSNNLIIPPMNDKGNYMALWERINNKWQIQWYAPVSELPLLTR
jgi:ketosteroid isomerase-like protein